MTTSTLITHVTFLEQVAAPTAERNGRYIVHCANNMYYHTDPTSDVGDRISHSIPVDTRCNVEMELTLTGAVVTDWKIASLFG